ncbi:hypothetical protein EZV62_025805 [Acer yangbiense]|uniref:Uncharacterized protein n=1 Tax=Acer yangbiense TaxID=1000413 RepID=A0A5C7GYV5_9ROSI|nr:hypothetical protein EZV62_025805 [Acer yangbiense]
MVIQQRMEGQQQAMQEGRGFMIAKSFNCVIPTLLGVIQVNNEGKGKSPFETHPAQIFMPSQFAMLLVSFTTRSILLFPLRFSSKDCRYSHSCASPESLCPKIGDDPQLNFMIAKSFNCVIPTLLGVIQVNNEGKGKSPFETHPAQMWVFVFSLIIYFSAAQRSVHIAIISGSLSSVSLISVLLPCLLGALIFIPWAFVPLILAYQIHAVSIRDASRQLHHKINTIISTSIQQQRLPV